MLKFLIALAFILGTAITACVVLAYVAVFLAGAGVLALIPILF